jgi:hypothetical protein
MPFVDAPNNFYIGRAFDPKAGELDKETPVYYDSRDLTTHGLIVGMTGSGKTGMALGLLEEAILDGIPAILVDPKGDLGNLMLTFPEFRPQDFQPWVLEDEARRENMDVAALAAKKAEQWQKGLADWDITPERMQTLLKTANITLYTPGSESGIPVSILASLRAPKGSFADNAEAYREQISSLTTAILALAGIDAQPMQDPRHVLLANIFEHNWKQGQDLTLETLITQVQKPPFDRLGVMPVEDFFPSKERFGLAMALNAVIASPSFQSWLSGVPMDIQSLLYTPEGKPRVAVFYIAHLEDSERMFVMTLILETLLSWVRQQAGTSSLRALLYVDEIFGFFPPIANPPSKEPMLRLLKQARAFGVGVLLATQNPVDLDYKGLANIGTWFIGRLQSDGDRERIISGLKEAASAGDMELSEVAQMIANLKSRVFLMRNIHNKGVPVLFGARWAMSYLAGPFTRQQISTLMKARKDTAGTSNGTSVAPASADTPLGVPTVMLPSGFSQQPPVLKDVEQFFLPVKKSAQEAIAAWEAARGDRADSIDGAQVAFVPALLAQVEVLYDDKKARLRTEKHYAFRVTDVPASGYLRWSDFAGEAVDRTRLDNAPRGTALFGELPAALADARRLKDLKDDLLDTIYKDFPLTISHNPQFGVFAALDEDPGAFEARLRQAAREQRDTQVDEVTEKLQDKLDKLEERRTRKAREVQEDETRVASSNQKDIADIALGVLGMLTGNRRSSTGLTRIGRAAVRAAWTSAPETSLEKSRAELAEIDGQIAALQQEMQDQLADVQTQFDEAAAKVESYAIAPLKKDIEVEVFALVWLPHYVFTSGGQQRLASAE